MRKTLPISEVKARLPEFVKGVQEREEEVVATRNGRAAAVLLNVEEYERLKATIGVLSDRKGLSFEEVFGDPLSPRKARGRR